MKYTHVPGRMQPWDEFHENPFISPERMILLSEYFVWAGVNLLHLHAIRDSKTWNDSDKTSTTAGNYKTSFIIPWFPDDM
jgi:hypothetical protein